MRGRTTVTARRLARLVALFFALGTFAFALPAAAQNIDGDEALQFRFGADFKKKINKRWAIAAGPELRTAELDPDRYLLDVVASYEPFEYLVLKGSLRADLNERRLGLGYGLRPGFSAAGRLPLGDFRFEGRLFYTYDFGYLREEEHRLRYRLKLEYDIPGVPLDIEGGGELFQILNDGVILKMRYEVELGYKFHKTKKLSQSVYLGYMFDYFFVRPLNTHIPALGYKLQF